MSEQQQEQQSGDEATTPVSETAEQGTSTEIGRVDESDSTSGGTAVDEVTAGEETAAATEERPSSHAPDENPDDEEKAHREANRTKPVWDVRTHGALAEDDARRERYEVVGEQSDTEG